MDGDHLPLVTVKARVVVVTVGTAVLRIMDAA